MPHGQRYVAHSFHWTVAEDASDGIPRFEFETWNSARTIVHQETLPEMDEELLSIQNRMEKLVPGMDFKASKGEGEGKEDQAAGQYW